MSRCTFAITFQLFAFCLLLGSCTGQTATKKVYLNFEIDSTPQEAQSKREELSKQGLIQEKDGLWYHQEVTSQNGRKYYSTPIFQTDAKQTFISMIRVVYFDDLEFADNIVQDTKEGNSGSTMYLSRRGPGEYAPGFFSKLDILQDLEKGLDVAKEKTLPRSWEFIKKTIDGIM